MALHRTAFSPLRYVKAAVYAGVISKGVGSAVSTWNSSLKDSAWIAFACINAILSFSVFGNAMKVYGTYAKDGVVIYPNGFWFLVVSVVALAGLTTFFVMKSEQPVNRIGMIALGALGPVGVAAFALYRLYDHFGFSGIL